MRKSPGFHEQVYLARSKPEQHRVDAAGHRVQLRRILHLSNTACSRASGSATADSPSLRGATSHTAFGDSGIAGNHWTEHDLTLDYGFALNDKVSVNVGYINYAFPNFREGRYSNEIYGAISVDTILQPSFGVYGDMHNGDGMYYNFGVGHSVDAGSGVALNLSASIGLNQGQWIEKTAVSDVMPLLSRRFIPTLRETVV